jgi:Family of unknown function (DUF6252)
MKKNIYLLFVVFLSLIINIKNCEAQIIKTSVDANNYLKATVKSNAANYNFTAQQIAFNKGKNASKPSFVIIALSTQGRIEMKLNKAITVGTYSLNTTDKKSVLFYAASKGFPFTTSKCSDAIGTLIITEYSATKIKGTFSFTGKQLLAKCETSEKVEITNGSFEIKL